MRLPPLDEVPPDMAVLHRAGLLTKAHSQAAAGWRAQTHPSLRLDRHVHRTADCQEGTWGTHQSLPTDH